MNSWPEGMVSVHMVPYKISERKDIKSNLERARSFANEQGMF
jgi:hypothetical protein